MKKLALLSLLMVPAMLLASGHADGEATRYFAQTGRETDFWPRVVNFTIFASLLYYLIASPIKNFFVGRKEGIAGQLKEIEDKLQAAKDEITEANESELILMEKQLAEKMTLEERRSAREAIDEILSENITNDDIMIDESKVVDIISKKVA
ncbi:MAG: F0F1 ATP synthase subunit B [Epsilonproteobacteria bacterium 4484_65]|nr:MAG: F0F1 ATP synthase subunit B [Epsilonproteobacteria bacterium 4484_65]